VTVAAEQAASRRLYVAAHERIADGVVSLTLRDPLGRDLPSWSPGANVTLELGPHLHRQYSLCGDPADRTGWTVGVLRDPDGRGGSDYVHDSVRVGGSLTVSGPRNNFELVESERYLMIAGGIGITALKPMLEHADATGRSWSLVYCGRSRQAMPFAEALTDRFGDRVSIFASDEGRRADLETLIGGVARDTEVYCCGPTPMLTAVRSACESRHVGLRTELFSGAATEGGQELPFEAHLARSGRTVSVDAGQSLLVAIEEAGVELGWSCLEGTCGTCETRILEGEADHRDAILSASERAAHDYLMPCVSRAAGPRIVLDL
jgi:ferredoxin-NADP reductase